VEALNYAIKAGFIWAANEVNYKMTSKGTRVYIRNWNMVRPIQIYGR